MILAYDLTPKSSALLRWVVDLLFRFDTEPISSEPAFYHEEFLFDISQRLQATHRPTLEANPQRVSAAMLPWPTQGRRRNRQKQETLSKSERRSLDVSARTQRIHSCRTIRQWRPEDSRRVSLSKRTKVNGLACHRMGAEMRLVLSPAKATACGHSSSTMGETELVNPPEARPSNMTCSTTVVPHGQMQSATGSDQDRVRSQRVFVLDRYHSRSRDAHISLWRYGHKFNH